MSTLALSVLLLWVIVGLAVIVGAGYVVHRRPALNPPVMTALTAAGVLAAFLVGVSQADSRADDARPSDTVSPSRR